MTSKLQPSPPNSSLSILNFLFPVLDIECTEKVKKQDFHHLSQSSQLLTIWMSITTKVCNDHAFGGWGGEVGGGQGVV